MKLSCLPVSLYGEFASGRMTLEAWFQWAAELGLDGADISVAHLGSLTPSHLRALRTRAADLGVRIAMLVTYSDFCQPDGAARAAEQAAIAAQIEAAAELGAPFVRLTAGQAWPGVSLRAGLAWAIEGLSRAAAHAAACGVQAVYENHTRGSVWRWNDFSQPLDRFLAIADATRGTELGLLFDTANNLALHDDPRHALEHVLDRVTTVHLADIERAGSFRPVVIGTGASPHRALLSTLRGAGFDGWISVEEASRTGRAGLETAVRHADAVWTAAGGAPRSG